MSTKPGLCKGCLKEAQARIIDNGHYNEHAVPVWYCSGCKLHSYVFYEDRYVWVDLIKWDSSCLLYGSVFEDEPICLGCNKPTMYANTVLTTGDIFPYYEGLKPSWCCYVCGFSTKAMRQNRYMWADMYKGWKKSDKPVKKPT
jgi:hypothetical protein